MSSIDFDIVKNLISQKKYSVISEYARISHPDKSDIIINEYAGNGVRLYKDDKGNTRVLCPKNMTYVQEGHVAQAIANGTIFDDADEVDHNATMIERTSIPYEAMVNSGRCTPKHLKPVIAIVIGKMDDNGSFKVDDGDRQNGVNLIKDLSSKKHDVSDVVDNYLEKDKDSPYGMELGKKIKGLRKDVDEICDTDPEDCVTDDDCCDSYDDFDIEELEKNNPLDYDKDDDDDDDTNVEESFSEYIDDDIVYQEGAIKTLKRLGYDPKTKTLLTDIPDPKGKKGEKLRCSVKFGDAISMTNGPCITGLDTGKPEIHIPIKDLFGDTKKTVEVLKHEEGHLYVSLDKERFTKDFERSKKLIDKYSDKLGDHGNVPEEYVVDLYSAKNSGYGGEGLIKFLKEYSVKNRKKANGLKKSIAKFLRVAKTVQTKIYSSTADKDLESAKKTYDDEYNRLANGLREWFLFLSDTVIPMIAQKFDPKDRGYAAQFNESESDFVKSFKKTKKRCEEIISNVKNIVSSSISEKEYVAAMVKISGIKKLLDEFCDSADNEVKARISFIKRYVNESADVTDVSTEDDIVEEEAAATEATTNGSVNSVPVPMSAQTKATINTKAAAAANNTASTNSVKVPKSDDVKQEGFLSKKPKKLKPIPRDIIAYITVEMNDIHSANDQAMLSGYTCSKIELVDFYLTVLDTQDARYIVPHNKQYLEMMKRELETLLAKILRIRPINRSEQIWRVNYPTT